MGYVYLIRNKDLYKIGVSQNLERRMKKLKPDEIIKTLDTNDFEKLEKKLHKKFKEVRIPQTEYFRLSKSQVFECCQELSISAYRRGKCNPILIGLVVGALSPFASLIWGLRHRSILLTITPMAIIVCIELIFPSYKLNRNLNYYSKASCGLIAYIISKKNKLNAKK